jgi:WD40 repeat protein
VGEAVDSGHDSSSTPESAKHADRASRTAGQATGGGAMGEPSESRVHRFDVFLSHNSLDKPFVERLAENLEKAGLEPWLDSWYLEGGDPWQEELTAALLASGTCAVLIGPHGLGDWAREELGVAQNRAAKDHSFRVFPVLLPTLPDRFQPSSELPPFLVNRIWVDLRAGIDEPSGFQRLIRAISRARLTPNHLAGPLDETSPYRGLRPFEEEQAAFFFGRDGDVQRLLEKLKGNRFLAVLGPSGSGKSSLVRAGLVPAFRRGEPPASSNWPIRLLTPGARPLEALAVCLAELSGAPDRLASARQFRKHLREDQQALHLAIRLASPDNSSGMRIVLVVDQLEEIFTLCDDEAERSQFLANLLYAATVPGGSCVVILTLRADFYQRCAAYPEFASQLAAQQYLVSPLSLEALGEVIESPAQRAGLQLESGLLDVILDDVKRQPGGLPLLEHALWELWQRRRGRILGLEGYRETGGVAGALAKRADELYGELTPEEQSIARRVLLRLTQPGEGTEDTRRSARMVELVGQADDSARVESVVGALTDARLLTTSGDDQTGERTVDVAHEALIRGWPRLRTWIDEDRAGLRVLRRLTEAAHDWERSARDEGLLYRGTRLNESIEWRARNESSLNEGERTFLDEGVALRDRDRRLARRRLQLTIGGLITTLILVTGLALLAMYQAREADQQRALALSQGKVVNEARLTTLSRELAATASVHTSDEPEVSLLLAEEAWKTKGTPEADEALRTALWLSPLRTRMQGREGVVLAAAFSPDQSRVVTVAQGAVRVWEASTGAELVKIPTTPNQVKGASFSPDGEWVIGATSDGTALVWEARAGKLEAELGGQPGPVTGPGFASPSSRWSVTAGGTDKPVRVWDVSTGRTLTQLNRDAQRGVRSALSSDGNLVVTAETDTARVWEAGTGSVRSTLRGHNKDVTQVAFTPDATRVITGNTDTVLVWDIRTGQELRALRGLTSLITSMSVSPDGRRVVAGDRAGTAWIWDLESGQPIAELPGHFGSIFQVAFSSDGRWVLTSGGGQVSVSDASTGALLNKFQASLSVVWDAIFSPDRRLVLTASVDGSARIWAARTGGFVTELRGHDGPVASAVFSTAAAEVATTSSVDGTARLWDASSGKQVNQLDGFPSPPSLGVVSPDGTMLIAAGQTGMPQIREIATGILIPIFTGQAASMPRTLAISPGGDLAVATSGPTTLKLLETRSGQSLAELTVPQNTTRLARFSGDGERVLLVSTGPRLNDHELSLWDWRSGRLVLHSKVELPGVNGAALSADSRWAVTTHGGSLAPESDYAIVWDLTGSTPAPLALRRVHSGPLGAAAFSPDGRWLATASVDATVRLWSTASWRPTVVLSGHTKAVNSASFSPDSTKLVTASADGTSRVYSCEVCVPVADLLTLVRARVGRELTLKERQQWMPEAPGQGL